ncbi:hypothetical protein [Williamsia deligens]|uniref:Uncharacterized protein n=1 Tax=Williamsia deligens TaxID=321325 RepID=A0ABW3GCM3_9NOCA|nr:hypothetical protein [Williamsia deligens]MCP2196318.1 hypothetical protein [Williamsia deligens]
MPAKSNTVDLEDGRRIVRWVFDGTEGDYTWTKPVADSGFVVSYHRVAVINGGRRDSGVGSSSPEGAFGGLGGGWQERFYADSELAATVAVHVGRGADYQGTSFDPSSYPETVSSFGSLSGINGSNLIVYRDGTAGLSPNAPGRGGQGGGSFRTGSSNAIVTTFGRPGESSAVARGGDVAPYIDGNSGQSAPTDPVNYSGGGGGGGGSGTGQSTGTAFGGSDGGSPGGGAGGQGGILPGAQMSPGYIGKGGIGGVCVWTYMSRLPSTTV